MLISRILKKISIKLRCFIIKSMSFLFRRRISIGSNCFIDRRVVLNTYGGGHIKIGNNCELNYGALIATYGGDITIGDNCSINPYCVIYGHGGLTIGNGVRIATHTVIVPGNHVFDDTSKPIHQQGVIKKGIKIEDDVWIGAGVRILDGVIIRKGCIIGASSVLTKSTEEYGVYAGVPAKKIKSRKENKSQE